MSMNRFGGGWVLLCGPALCLLAGCSMFGGGHEAAAGPPSNASCPPAEQMQQAADSDYGRSLLARLSQRVTYPADALNAGQVGVVRLCARLNRDGELLDGRIASGSGYPLLDGAALVALGGLRYGKEHTALPKDLAPGQRHVWIAIPINFTPGPHAGSGDLPAPEHRPCKDSGSKDGDSGAREVSTEDWDGFPAQFSGAVRKELTYPPQAFEAKEAGVTQLCVSLDRDSHLLGVSVSRSSGSPMLDGASLAALGLIDLKGEIPSLPDRVRLGHDSVTFNQEIEWKPKSTE